MRKIQVLGIAPYQELESVMAETAASYGNIELYTYVGFLNDAVNFKKKFFNKQFDIIITRGGTADSLNRMIDTPFVSIEINDEDIVNAVNEALRYTKNVAFVSYPYVIPRVQALSEIFGWNLSTYTFDSPERINQTVRTAINDGARLIIGGAGTKSHVLSLGADFLMLLSGSCSVRKAFDNAILINGLLEKQRVHSSFASSILEKSPAAVFLFDSDGMLVYANLAAGSLLASIKDLDIVLSGRMERLRYKKQIRSTGKFGRTNVSMDAREISIETDSYYMFELRTTLQPPVTEENSAIQKYNIFRNADPESRSLTAVDINSLFEPEPASRKVKKQSEDNPAGGAIELNGTLDEIERRIIYKVMKEEGMNHTAAAKRLGISRSTLWRRLQE